MNTPESLCQLFLKGNNFNRQESAFLTFETFQKLGFVLEESICLLKEQFISLSVVHSEKGGKYLRVKIISLKSFPEE